MESVRGERDQRDDLADVAANQRRDTEPSEAWTRNLALDGHETPDRRSGGESREDSSDLVRSMRSAISATYRNKAKKITRRKALEMPSLPSIADYEASKMRANVKAVSMEHKVMLFQTRMAEEFARRTHPAQRHKRHHGGYLRLWFYFSSLAYRALNDRHKAGYRRPTRAELAEAIAAYAQRYAAKFLRSYNPQQKRTGYDWFTYVDNEQLDYLATTLAGAVLRDWDEGYIEEKAAQGGAGGSAPKKPRGLWADRSNLLQLQLLADWSDADLAQHFGCHAKTIKRGRGRLESGHP